MLGNVATFFLFTPFTAHHLVSAVYFCAGQGNEAERTFFARASVRAFFFSCALRPIDNV